MQYGLFIGRMAPIHLGHEVNISKMIERFGCENCFVGLGSCNSPMSWRNLFSYEERRDLILALFPGVRIFGVPDYPTDTEWLTNLDDILRCTGRDPKDMVVFGGCKEEVEWFIDLGREAIISNRFDGTTTVVSATEIRDCLGEGRPIEGMVNPLIAEKVRELFAKNWAEFKRK